MKLGDTLLYKKAKDDPTYSLQVVYIFTSTSADTPVIVGTTRNSEISLGEVRFYTKEFLEDNFEVKKGEV